MTRHAAVDPTFDAETGSYNNGNVEYYTCPTCNGVFVQDGNAFVRKTENEVHHISALEPQASRAISFAR